MYPEPKKQTRYRIYGPYEVNNIKLWKVVDLKSGQMVGPPCFTLQEAKDRAVDVLHGRVRFWIGLNKFKPHRI